MGNVDAKLYQHVGFEGNCVLLSEPCEDLRQFNFNDKISSIKIRRGVWLFYEHVKFGGKVRVLYPGDYPDLRKMGFNDKISSCRGILTPLTEPQLHLFAGKNYNGRMVTFFGSDANLVDNGFSDAASSAIVLSGRWSLCKDVNYGTPLMTYGYGMYPTLNCADNQISSVQLVAAEVQPQ